MEFLFTVSFKLTLFLVCGIMGLPSPRRPAILLSTFQLASSKVLFLCLDRNVNTVLRIWFNNACVQSDQFDSALQTSGCGFKSLLNKARRAGGKKDLPETHKKEILRGTRLKKGIHGVLGDAWEKDYKSLLNNCIQRRQTKRCVQYE